MSYPMQGGAAMPVVVVDGGSGNTGSITVSGPVQMAADLKIGTKGVKLTLSGGAGSVAIPDTATCIGVRPAAGSLVRIGLEAPDAEGTKTGDAVLADLKKGVPVDATVWNWFSLGGPGSGRTLYLKGGTSDVVEVYPL